MKKIICSAILLFLLGITLSCRRADTNTVIIYTSTEDFRTEHMQNLLRERFPNYDIRIQVLSTGNHAARLTAEGTKTEADIILNLETAYMVGLQDIFADLSVFDLSDFLPELV